MCGRVGGQEDTSKGAKLRGFYALEEDSDLEFGWWVGMVKRNFWEIGLGEYDETL